VSRFSVILRLFLLAKIMMKGSLMMMMRRRMVMSGSLMMMLTGRMLGFCHGAIPPTGLGKRMSGYGLAIDSIVRPKCDDPVPPDHCRN
jgi:hypothetical protein